MIKVNLLKNSVKRKLTPAERSKEWRQKHPEIAKASTKAWREKNKEHLREYERNRDKSRIPLEKRREYSRRWLEKQPPEAKKDRWLKSTYGISFEEYSCMVEAQGGRCAVCGEVPEGHTLNVDHDHETGAVRGLLCWPCNSALGKFKDSPELLEAAAAYLRKHEAKQDDKAA